jgi:hypothetical protein
MAFRTEVVSVKAVEHRVLFIGNAILSRESPLYSRFFEASRASLLEIVQIALALTTKGGRAPQTGSSPDGRLFLGERRRV